MADTTPAASFEAPQLDSTLPPAAASEVATERPLGLWADTWRRLRRNKLALVGLGIITVFMVIGMSQIIANFLDIQLTPYDPNGVDYALSPKGLGALMGGAILTETVFSRFGIGFMVYNAILARDLPVVAGGVLFATFVFVFANLVVDIGYAVVDPRIRYE